MRKILPFDVFNFFIFSPKPSDYASYYYYIRSLFWLFPFHFSLTIISKVNEFCLKENSQKIKINTKAK